jgi:hypothetical protein
MVCDTPAYLTSHCASPCKKKPGLSMGFSRLRSFSGQLNWAHGVIGSAVLEQTGASGFLAGSIAPATRHREIIHLRGKAPAQRGGDLGARSKIRARFKSSTDNCTGFRSSGGFALRAELAARRARRSTVAFRPLAHGEALLGENDQDWLFELSQLASEQVGPRTRYPPGARLSPRIHSSRLRSADVVCEGSAPSRRRVVKPRTATGFGSLHHAGRNACRSERGATRRQSHYWRGRTPKPAKGSASAD